MYISLEEAKKEVWKRWNDADLRRRVLEYVGDVPEYCEHEPRAVLWRWLATPNYESLRFWEMAKKANLKPIYFELIGDKFCSKNSDKKYLGKLSFFNGKGRNNGDRVTCCHAIDFCLEDGKAFREIRTISGQDFVTFHHRMLSQVLPALELTDKTDYCKKMGGMPEHYYHRMMAFFICHGILFENFLEERDEGNFVREIAWPAIRRVTEHFGIKPLIVRLLPEESEADPYWCWYPGHLEEEVKAHLAGGEAATRFHAAEGSVGGLTQECNQSWK